MKRYLFPLITSLAVLLTATISFCEAVDTSKLVFVVMKPKPASGDQVITLTFWTNDEIIAVRQYQSGKLLKSEGKVPDGPVLELHDNGSLNNVVNMSGENRHGKVVSYYKTEC